MKLLFHEKIIFIAVHCLLILFISNCSQKEKSETLPEEKILLKEKDGKDRVRKTVATGRIPGEDIFLTIKKFDTVGRVVAEYGAKPYGEKFKSTFKYDQKGRKIEEVEYNFSGGQDFENHKSEHNLYSLIDTVADFENAESKTKIVYAYQDSEGLTREIHYLLKQGSLKKEMSELVSDTTYLSKREK